MPDGRLQSWMLQLAALSSNGAGTRRTLSAAGRRAISIAQKKALGRDKEVA